eukprot:Pgem_evm1s18366
MDIQGCLTSYGFDVSSTSTSGVVSNYSFASLCSGLLMPAVLLVGTPKVVQLLIFMGKGNL